MKKLSFIMFAGLLALCAFFNVSCLSTGASDPELFRGNSYKLTTISFQSDITIEDEDTALSFIENIPFEAIQNQIFEAYNVSIDAEIFNHDYLAENLKALVSTNKAQEEVILGWAVDNPEKEGKSTEELAGLIEGTAQMTILLYTTNDYYSGLSVLTTVYNNANEVLPYSYRDEYWTPVPVVADKDSAAILSFSKYIKPTYLVIDDQIVMYPAYANDNSAGNGAIYVDTTKDVIIITTVNDPGIMMLYDPVTFFNREIQGEYEAGKTYSVKHKVSDRLQKEWKVDFEFEEK